MREYVIMTDSCCDLTDHMAKELELTVVPDTGTDALTGLYGRIAIDIRDGKHFYTFDYDFRVD